MADGSESRRVWGWWIAGIIAAGILSRLVRTGYVLFDKYLGDALYAAMVYGMFRLAVRARVAAVGAAVVMTAIETFQLTGIPARMLMSEVLLTRIFAWLLGVQFSGFDLVAYGVGIGCLLVVDTWRARAGRFSPRR